MSKYVESNLTKGEVIVKKGEKNILFLLPVYLFDIINCVLFFMLSILLQLPLFLVFPVLFVFAAIIDTMVYSSEVLVITNKRIIGKKGILSLHEIDAPLNKIQFVRSRRPFFGRIFNYGTITILTAAGRFRLDAIKDVETFKGILLSEMDRVQEEQTKRIGSVSGFFKFLKK